MTENIGGQDLKRGLFYVYEQFSEEFRHDEGGLISEILDDLTAVCIPARTVQTTTLNHCVWNGLSCLHVTDCLSQYTEYAANVRVNFLFREILNLEDADFETYLNELIYLQKRMPVEQLNFDDICAIYAELLATAKEEEDWKSIRKSFRGNSLIFLPADQIWVAPKSCVWADASNVGGQYGIAAVYPDLAGLFTEKLRIQAPTIATYVEQLRLLAAEDRPLQLADIKRAMNCINDLKPTVDNLKEMMQLPCLPVRIPGSTVRLMSPSEDFFISDRREYGELFEEKVPILDFSLEEIHSLHLFLDALGTTDRYMSVAVKETTRVQRPSETPSRELSQAFRAKSKALYRCAFHYRSIKAQTHGSEIYHKLRHVLVYESDGFTKNIRLSYGDLTVNAPSDRGTFHLEEKDGILNLFVPRDNAQREKCYLTQLPNELQQYLQLVDNGAEASKAFLLVIQASIYVLDEILDDNGIVRVPDSDSTAFERAEEGSDPLGEELYVNVPAERPDSPSHEEPLPEAQADIDHDAYTPSTAEEVLSVTAHSRSSTPYIAVRRTEHVPRYHSPGVQDAPPEPPLVEPSQYVRILEKVIRIAQRTNIPSRFAGLAATTSGLTSEEHTSAFGSRSQNQLAHDIKIGAAGELFVFELLLHLNLLGFSRENWKSTIRKEVTVHPAYADLTPWNGVETSDIIYHDSASTLTQILINNGYLSRNQWQDTSPRYLIEVKSTTGACNNAFFMSKSQYRRMQQYTLDHPTPLGVTTIYVIFRVYNLGKDNMSLRIYVDPDALRRQDVLRFAAESYSVTPVNNAEGADAAEN